MKLPDFSKFAPFLEAKRQMGIQPTTIGSLKTIVVAVSGPTYKELIDLNGQGIDVELDVVLENSDGTLGYKNKRVILYIRDVAGYGNFESDPKFHVANCRTLKDMRSNNRFGRYVIANKDTGLFSVRTKQGGKMIEKKLSVCQNCLDYLSFSSFELNWEESRRRQVVKAFSIKRFFDLYPKSLHYEIPRHNELTAPANDYPINFSQISYEYRNSCGWKCENESCGVVLGQSEYRKFLHVHHSDGQKNNNSKQNLKALCLHCHAQQFMHHHMRSLPEFATFQVLRNSLLAS